MVHYFHLLEEVFFDCRLRPALAKCRQLCSFEPCRSLCRDILRNGEFHSRESLMAQVETGLPFRPGIWQALAGELMVAGADLTPRLAVEPPWLVWLLTQRVQHTCHRADFACIQQVLYGSRDLTMGSGCYRPDHAGFNAVADLPSLMGYLEKQDPSAWRPEHLWTFPGWDAEKDAGEELADLVASWPELLALYHQAYDSSRVVVCEEP